MPAYQGANYFSNGAGAFLPAGFPPGQPAVSSQFGPAFPFPSDSPNAFGFPPAPPPFPSPFPSGQMGAFPPPPPPLGPPLMPGNYFGSGGYGRPRSRHRSSSRRRRHRHSSSSSDSDEPRRGSPFGANPYNNPMAFGINPPPPIPPRVGSPFAPPPVRTGW